MCHRSNFEFGPHCECRSGYKRLSNGICVQFDDPQCALEYQPSPGNFISLFPYCFTGPFEFNFSVLVLLDIGQNFIILSYK